MMCVKIAYAHKIPAAEQSDWCTKILVLAQLVKGLATGD
jgi:hypothetical protein